MPSFRKKYKSLKVKTKKSADRLIKKGGEKMQNKELSERQEMALFENNLAQAFLANGKIESLAMYLKVSDKKLRSGMTAEEIDAVKSRADEAYKDWVSLVDK